MFTFVKSFTFLGLLLLSFPAFSEEEAAQGSQPDSEVAKPAVKEEPRPVFEGDDAPLPEPKVIYAAPPVERSLVYGPVDNAYRKTAEPGYEKRGGFSALGNKWRAQEKAKAKKKRKSAN